MTQSWGILGELLVALLYTAIKAGTQELIKQASELFYIFYSKISC